MSISIYTAEQTQQWDQFSIENEPISSIDLMERAASLACKSILGRNSFNNVNVFCGPGNNGGDGLVIARLLAESQKNVSVYYLKFAEPTKDFKVNLKRLPKAVNVVELSEDSHEFELKTELLVDAIFGSGLNRSIKGWIAEVIIKLNSSSARKISIDIPSGLFSNSNLENDSFPAVVEADETLTFMSLKMPFFYPPYAGFVGNFRIINIGLHKGFKETPLAHYVIHEDIQIESRKTFSYKGSHGFLSIIGGLNDMTGAAILTAKAAAKSGAGYVNVISTENTRIALNISLPEALWQNAKNFALNSKNTAIAIGPGLGTDELALSLLKNALQENKPIVIDADALNLISIHKELSKELPKDAILTPHLGELKRLIGTFRSDEELLEAQINYSKDHQVYIIQKGPYSKLTTPQGKIYVNSTGNPGMASAGMGDALTGLIGALLAQDYSSEKAAIYGMFLHGLAADEQAKNKGEIGLLSTDLIDNIPSVINQFLRTSK